MSKWYELGPDEPIQHGDVSCIGMLNPDWVEKNGYLTAAKVNSKEGWYGTGMMWSHLHQIFPLPQNACKIYLKNHGAPDCIKFWRKTNRLALSGNKFYSTPLPLP